MQQVARYERANIRIAYGFYSQALAGYNQKLSIEKMLTCYIFTFEKVFFIWIFSLEKIFKARYNLFNSSL